MIVTESLCAFGDMLWPLGLSKTARSLGIPNPFHAALVERPVSCSVYVAAILDYTRLEKWNLCGGKASVASGAVRASFALRPIEELMCRARTAFILSAQRERDRPNIRSRERERNFIWRVFCVISLFCVAVVLRPASAAPWCRSLLFSLPSSAPRSWVCVVTGGNFDIRVLGSLVLTCI